MPLTILTYFRFLLSRSWEMRRGNRIANSNDFRYPLAILVLDRNNFWKWTWRNFTSVWTNLLTSSWKKRASSPCLLRLFLSEWQGGWNEKKSTSLLCTLLPFCMSRRKKYSRNESKSFCDKSRLGIVYGRSGITVSRLFMLFHVSRPSSFSLRLRSILTQLRQYFSWVRLSSEILDKISSWIGKGEGLRRRCERYSGDVLRG